MLFPLLSLLRLLVGRRWLKSMEVPSWFLIVVVGVVVDVAVAVAAGAVGAAGATGVGGGGGR